MSNFSSLVKLLVVMNNIIMSFTGCNDLMNLLEFTSLRPKEKMKLSFYRDSWTTFRFCMVNVMTKYWIVESYIATDWMLI